jgi:hypothetical protein
MTNNFSKMQNTDSETQITKLELADFESVFYCPIELLSFDDFLKKYCGTTKIIKIYNDETNTYETIHIKSNDNMDITENLIINSQISDKQTIYSFDEIPFLLSEIHLIVEDNKVISHSHVNDKIDSEYILEEKIIEDILSITTNYKDKLYIELGLISINGKQEWKVINVCNMV